MKTLVSLILSLACLLLAGCASTGKTLASVAVTVDSAMQGWATYAVTHEVSDEEHATVKRAYHKYQLAMSAASDAYQASVKVKNENALTVAKAAVLAAKDDLVTMIREFSHKEVTP